MTIAPYDSEHMMLDRVRSSVSYDIDEQALRTRLGVPQDAEAVLVFGETSHWDPNWLYTSEEYYEKRIWRVLDAAIAALVEEPRRVFSVESLYFIELYWERNPEQRELIRQLINERRLRLTGTGMTTPDTVLPHTEAIMRDYLHGQEWLRTRGMTPEPRIAYLPDDFGYSPALPSILRALGIDLVGVTRLDGMYFIGCDYRRRSSYPLPGSSADLLMRKYKTLDFIWRAPDGAEALCHWNAFSYFQGDMIACMGVIRWMGTVFGINIRSERHVARRIRGYVKQLRPLTLTPYMYCPIGCDFNDPVSRLVDLIDRYNGTRFEETGVWAVNAGMDDYLQLVGCHRERLPTIELDPNPYWMGFYASRQEAKLRCNRIARKLLLAEKLTAGRVANAAARGHSGLIRRATTENALTRELEHAWDLLVLSNHHDFITGTSPDRIWEAEQQPCLERAEELVDSALKRATPDTTLPPQDVEAPVWTFDDGVLDVTTPFYRVKLNEAVGGCIVSYVGSETGQEMLTGPANDLIAYRDSGGLWRMGHEYLGGTFREAARASTAAATIQLCERGAVLEVQVVSELAGKRFVRWLWLRNDSPIIRMRLNGTAAKRRTVTCAFPTVLSSQELAMDVPGGIIVRPARKLYDPTFWPARSFVHLHDQTTDRGLAAFLGGPAAASLGRNGNLEWLTFRNAPKEVAFGCVPILAHPARGTDPHEGHFDYAVWFTTSGDYRQNHLPLQVRRALRAAMFPHDAPDLDEKANAVLVTDSQDVIVLALKVARRGPGLIARLRNIAPNSSSTQLHCPGRRVRAARLCDARERDIKELPVEDGVAVVPLSGGLVSVRLLF